MNLSRARRKKFQTQAGERVISDRQNTLPASGGQEGGGTLIGPSRKRIISFFTTSVDGSSSRFSSNIYWVISSVSLWRFHQGMIDSCGNTVRQTVANSSCSSFHLGSCTFGKSALCAGYVKRVDIDRELSFRHTKSDVCRVI